MNLTLHDVRDIFVIAYTVMVGSLTIAIIAIALFDKLRQLIDSFRK